MSENKMKNAPQDAKIILSVRNLKQHFKTGVGKYKIYNKAVDGVSFDIKEGEVFSLVGESGCGKTTTGRTIIKLYKPTDGEVYLMGKRIAAGTRGLKRELRDISKNQGEEIKKIKEDSNLNDGEKQAKISEFKKQQKARVKEIKAEIKQRNIDQKAKYRPSVAEVKKISDNSKVEIDKLREEIKKVNQTFEAFKAKAFFKSDALDPSVGAVEKRKIHDEELKEYRRQRTLKNEKIKEINEQIDYHITAPKFIDRPILNQMQMVFQDPIDSLNPRMTIKDIIAEALYINGIKSEKVVVDKVLEVIKLVGLQPDHIDHYPHEFSGGQRQRIGIARAIISEPKIIIADEPISALDVSIQAQIINLLNELRKKLGLTLLFIAHDLSVVKFLSDKVAIMYFGKIVEMGTKEKVFDNPLHPYTLSLISSIPMPDPEFEKLRTKVNRYDPTQHDYSQDLPVLQEIEPDHFIYANDAEMEKYRKQLNDQKL